MIRSLMACAPDSRFVRRLFSILLLAGTATAGDALATTYRVVVLPIPAGTTLNRIYGSYMDVNARGDVVGNLSDSGSNEEVYAVEWSPPDYAVRILPTDGATSTLVSAINDAGDSVGIIWTQIGNWRNLLWKSDGSFVRLTSSVRNHGGLAGPINLNADGLIVGGLQIGGDVRPAFWPRPRILIPMINVTGPADAWAVNDSGVIVGCPLNGSGVLHGFRSTPGGGVEELEDLPGGNNHTCAYDVNNSGQFVGFGYSNIGQRALLWEADGSMHDLGDLPGGASGIGYYANRLNSFGEVIGSTTNGGDWLWAAGTGMLPIDSLIDPGDPLHGAGTFSLYGINDAGVLAAALNKDGGSVIPVLLIPQP